jgi:hypothetical protein
LLSRRAQKQAAGEGQAAKRLASWHRLVGKRRDFHVPSPFREVRAKQGAQATWVARSRHTISQTLCKPCGLLKWRGVDERPFKGRKQYGMKLKLRTRCRLKHCVGSLVRRAEH